MLALVLLNGCGTEDVQKSEDPTSQAFQQALVADLQPVAPRIVRSDPIEIAEPGEYAEPSWAKTGAVPADTPADDHRLVAHFGPSTGGRVQILEYDEQALEELAQALAARGVAEAVAPPGAELDPTQEKGWSSNWFLGPGVDNRYDMSSLSNWELKTIGRLAANGWGTGTLFGRRLVLTVAHAIINNNGAYVPGQFSAHRKGTTTPYGTQNVVAAWWGGKYIQNCTCASSPCPPGFWSDCLPEDWAVVLLQDNFPSGHPGWLGF
ncbi:MAG: hypothetical protein U1E22_09220, partial [Coriobacteriia bacterium]|nr:hypothetical protein [Coriobacteriia bacterium]